MSQAMIKDFDEPELDMEKAKAFTGVLAGHFDSAALTIMLSIGHKTGLLDVMGRLPPASSAVIAERAGLRWGATPPRSASRSARTR